MVLRAGGPQALFVGRILSFDDKAALIWARLMAEGKTAGRPRGGLDMIIAAVAGANQCVLVTDNERDIAGLQIVNPIRGEGRCALRGRKERLAPLRSRALELKTIGATGADFHYLELTELAARVKAREIFSGRVASEDSAMLIEHAGKRPTIDPTAWVGPDATVCVDVTIGLGVRVLHGARLIGEAGGTIRIGRNAIVMENAVIRASRSIPARSETIA